MPSSSRDARLALTATIVLLLALVFAADLMTRLGIAVWVFYLVPIALALFQDRAALPFVAAAVSTVLIVAGFYLSPPGLSPEIAQTNRALGSLVLWVSAGIAYLFIGARERTRTLSWIQDVRVTLSTRARVDEGEAALGATMLQTLCARLDAPVAVLWEAEGDGLRRLASWAVQDPDALPTRLDAGRGLPGQCLVDGRLLRIHPLPAESLRVGGSLAVGAPATLVAMPLTAEGRVVAVIELGLLDLPRAWDDVRSLLEQLAEPLGMALRAARDRTRLQALLEETRRQGAVLEAQQEELRASNEELERQSTELRASQSRLEEQQAELEQSNQRLADQNRELETQREAMRDAQRALERYAAALEQADRYKSEFLANMSHELRTPLNSSLILAKLLAENRGGQLSEEQVRHARTIVSANNDLLALINDVLDLAKIEAGHAGVEPAEVEVAALVDALRATFEPQARERGLTFDATVSPDAPRRLRTDPQRLRQVLANFLSNALKFTPEGRVGLTVDAADARGGVAFTVWDTGIGIDPAQHDTVFEAFRQADGSTSRRFGGTGLGLSISRELAALLGGTIALDSAPGRGSRFALRLPAEIPPASGVPPRRAHGSLFAPPLVPHGPVPPASPPAADPPGAPRAITAPAARAAQAGANDPGRAAGNARIIAPAAGDTADARVDAPPVVRTILIVEDDAAFARILADLAAELDFDAIHASGATQAIELARAAPPAAILLDMGLPDESGLSVLERLKRDPATRHVPIHVVSVSDFRRTALELGAVGYALKPADREQLLSMLRGLDARLRRELRRVLIVEDDPRLRESIRALLAADGVELVDAGTVEAARAALAAGDFDCVVLDLVLPDGSGYDLLERLAASPSPAPPVIVYTGRALGRDEEHRIRRMAKSIIVKGARSPERLLDEVTLFLHQVEARLPPEKQRMLQQARERDRAFEGRTILLAEDDARNIFALSAVLEPLGAEVIVARDGREALERLDERPVDLVLMDVMMPVLDGLAAMRAIRARDEWARLPVIALTARAMPEDRAACLSAGADDYLSKPIDVDRLLSLCRVWMPK